jgi:hypothetical protein
MSDGAVVALRDLSHPDSTERSGSLISEGVDWVDLELTGGAAPISSGTLVGVQTSQNIYLGQVERGELLGSSQRLRIRVEHWLALQDASSIQKLWTQEQTD